MCFSSHRPDADNLYIGFSEGRPQSREVVQEINGCVTGGVLLQRNKVKVINIRENKVAKASTLRYSLTTG